MVPLETEFGTKRRIDQSSCNKDFSCVDGFCPSFVTVHGAAPVQARAAWCRMRAALPAPQIPSLDRPWNILVTGIGGTGIVTIGALLGMAAHSEGKQRDGARPDGHGAERRRGDQPYPHRRRHRRAGGGAARAAAWGAGRPICCWAATWWCPPGATRKAALRRGVTRVVLNTHEAPTADFVLDTDTRLPAAQLRRSILDLVGEGAVDQVNATALAAALLGDSIAANPFLLGFAWQKGCIPLSLESLMDAIELNGTAVEANKAAFTWGRCAAVDPARVVGGGRRGAGKASAENPR